MSSAVIARCLAIAEVLSAHRGGLSLGDIAAQAGMPKSAAYRMVSALCDVGYVMQLPNRDYRLTLRLPALGLRFLSNTDVVVECQPVLDRLADDVGELVRLALVSDGDLVWIAKAQGARRGLVVDPVMGRSVVPHATATGKVWLASLPQDAALRIVTQNGFGTPADHGPNVLQSFDALLAQVEASRTRGFGLAQQEAEPGISAIAVGIPLQVGDGIAGTLSVAGPSARLTQERLIGLLPQLRAAAAQMTGLEALISR